jgi:hypothetical protein
MALVRFDVSEKISSSIIRVTRIVELGTTLAVTSSRIQSDIRHWIRHALTVNKLLLIALAIDDLLCGLVGKIPGG